MTIKGAVTCTKELTGDCGVEAKVELGGTYTSSIVIENATSDPVKFCVNDQLPVLGASMSYVSTISGSVTGATPAGDGPIEDTVELGGMSTLTYAVSVTTVECAGTSTNVASIFFEGEKEPKWVAANPVIVGCPDLKAYPDDMTGRRPYNNAMVMHGFFGVGNNEQGQILMDLCESGFRIADLLTNPGIVKLMGNAALEAPEDKEAP